MNQSANTPYLLQILSELKDIKKDIFELKTDVSGLKTDVAILKKDLYELRDNVVYFQKSLSLIQEKSDTEYFREYLETNLPTLNIEVYNFGNFYNIDGKTITDIDGCISVDSLSKTPNTTRFKNNSKLLNPATIRNELFFLESKNMLDKIKFDSKIIQFTKILDILKNTTETHFSDIFKEMITSYPLKKNPTKYYFMFFANDMQHEIKSFLKDINEDTLTEDLYKVYVFKMFIAHPVYNKILDDIKDNPKLKKKFKNATSFDELLFLFKNKIFYPYLNFLMKFFIPYTKMTNFYKRLKGLVGFVFYGHVYLPLDFSYSTP